MLAAHDKRRLRDQRQALLDAVGERKQRPRFPPCITQPAEELVARGAALRIDRRTDEHHRPHAPRQAHGEFGEDLTAHRVRQKRRAPESGRVQPPGDRGGKIGNAQRGARPLTTPVAGQVRCEHGEGEGERLGEREHVVARDAVPRMSTTGGSSPATHAWMPRPDTSSHWLSIGQRAHFRSRLPAGRNGLFEDRPIMPGDQQAPAAASSQPGDAGCRAYDFLLHMGVSAAVGGARW